MIDLYSTRSPNVMKVAIMLEEVGRPWRGSQVDSMRGDNFDPAFLAVNPLGKVPAMVDHDGAPNQPMFESGAMLIYLAETYAPALYPPSGPARWEILKWLMYQMAFVGPMCGQLNHFQLVKNQLGTYAHKRYRDQAARAFADLERRLSVVPWLGGNAYSIADIAVYPWAGYLERQADAPKHPKLLAWRARIDERPAVQRARAKVKEIAESYVPKTELTDATVDRFFSRTEPGPPADMNAYMKFGPITTIS